MVEVTSTIPTPPEHVFGVLANGWLYVAWVVGASHVRHVDPSWPEEGTRIHHSVGAWPFMAHDVTKVLSVDPPRSLELDARLWPFGAAYIRLELATDGTQATKVRMSERVVRGPGRVLPDSLHARFLVPRNRESLRRLSALAVGMGGAARQGA